MLNTLVTRKEKIGSNLTRASFIPESFNEEKRTVDVVFSTGAQVMRYSWMEGTYLQELSMKKADVDLERMNSGAPILNNHGTAFFGGVKDLSDVIGVVEPGSAKIKKNSEGVSQGIATVRFSEREDVEPIFQDVKNGILPNLSIGFRIHENTQQKDAEDGTPIFRATKWEVFELSFVAIPADAGSQVRKNNELHQCKFLLKGETMSKRVEGTEAAEKVAVTEPKVDVEAIQRKAIEDERVRVTEITNAVRSAGLEDSFKDTLVNDGTTADEARKLVLTELGKKEETRNTSSQNIAVVTEERDTVKRGMEEALLHRANSRTHKLTDLGRSFRGMGLLDMARECLDLAGTKTGRMSRSEIAKIALRSHSTSDFPEILANVAGKTLRSSYDSAPQTFAPFTRRVEVPDFKQVSRVQLGDAPDLEKVLENGEIKNGTIGEAAEKYSIDTYAKMITMSRKMLVNDDMSAFSRIPELFGRASADLESDLVWNILFNNAALADSIALFHGSHNNLNAGGASAIDVASLGAARAAMRTQVGLGGRELNLTPSWLFVPAALETVAQQFITNTTPNAAGDVNPFAGNLKLGVESRIDGVDANSWYLMSMVDSVDMVELASLIGESGPMIDTEDMFDVEGIKIKARMDVGAKAIDFRGMQKNDGPA